jgi:hypothetical protein
MRLKFFGTKQKFKNAPQFWRLDNVFGGRPKPSRSGEFEQSVYKRARARRVDAIGGK